MSLSYPQLMQLMTQRPPSADKLLLMKSRPLHRGQRRCDRLDQGIAAFGNTAVPPIMPSTIVILLGCAVATVIA